MSLSKNGKTKHKSVSRLVAEAFIPNDNPIEKNTVDHINNNKLDNTKKNLQWLSLQDNIKKY